MFNVDNRISHERESGIDAMASGAWERKLLEFTKGKGWEASRGADIPGGTQWHVTDGFDRVPVSVFERRILPQGRACALKHELERWHEAEQASLRVGIGPHRTETLRLNECDEGWLRAIAKECEAGCEIEPARNPPFETLRARLTRETESVVVTAYASGKVVLAGRSLNLMDDLIRLLRKLS